MSRLALFAIVSFALAAVLTAIGTFGEDDPDVGGWIFVLAVAAVVAVVVFWLVARRYLGTDTAAPAALVLGVLSVLSIVVFWLGLPAVFAGGAALLGLDAREEARRRGDRGSAAVVALALAAIAVVLAVILAFTG